MFTTLATLVAAGPAASTWPFHTAKGTKCKCGRYIQLWSCAEDVLLREADSEGHAGGWEVWQA